MPDLHPLFYWVLIPIALIGGFLRGFAGFGGPLFMLPALTAFLSPPVAVGVMLWIDLSANIPLLPEARHHAAKSVVVPLAIGTTLTMPVGTYLLLSIDPVIMKRTICAAILAAALVILAGWRYRRRVNPPTYVGVGALSGLVMGATSLAAVTPLFLSAGTRSAVENRADFIVWVFLATVLLIGLLAVKGVLGFGDATTILVLTPAYLAGIVVGSRCLRHASERLARRTVLILIIAVAAVGLMMS